MAQNFMCDTVALDAPHFSDGWEEVLLLTSLNNEVNCFLE